MSQVPRRPDPSVAGALSRVSIVWHGRLFGPGGYPEETREFVLGLDAAGIRVRAVPLPSGDFRPALPRRDLARLWALTTTPLALSVDRLISVFHTTPWNFWRLPAAHYHVCRTMFETDRIPDVWVPICNLVDEIWVPSAFNVETFARSGVPRRKLVRIPEGIDLERFGGSVGSLPIPGRRGFNFLSVFEWQPRKGWDVLLRAFVEEFGPDEDVALILKVWPPDDRPAQQIRDDARSLLRRHGLAREVPRHVLFYHPRLPAEDLPRLYRAADAFVLPTRGEGWGRPLMEAMAMGLPVVATRWSGHLEFMNDENAYLVDHELVDVVPPTGPAGANFQGHRCAEPSVAHLRQLMRQVVEDRGAARRKGRVAREWIIASFSRARVARHVRLRLQQIAGERFGGGRRARAGTSRVDACRSSGGRAVVWEGVQFDYDPLALVNRELCLQFIEAGCTLSIRPGDRGAFDQVEDHRWQALAVRAYAPLPRPADVHVSHSWPPSPLPPSEGHWVVMPPWEFGSLPKAWLRTLSSEADEVWVPTGHVRHGCIESGVAPERVFVVPYGVDAERFFPGGEKLDLGARAAFRFLFVGGTIYRKGIDLLLRAYRDAFARSDDVYLVIKDIGGETFYRGQIFKKDIVALQRRRDAPPILYLESILPESQLPGLYRSCDVLVHPYRAEGFGLPILEAMACGVPAIVTNGGACLDFCSPSNCMLVQARRRYFPKRELGTLEAVKAPWVYEVDVRDLAKRMRYAYEHAAEMKVLGMKASEEARTQWTWRHAARKALERIDALRTVAHRRRRVSP